MKIKQNFIIKCVKLVDKHQWIKIQSHSFDSLNYIVQSNVYIIKNDNDLGDGEKSLFFEGMI